MLSGFVKASEVTYLGVRIIKLDINDLDIQFGIHDRDEIVISELTGMSVNQTLGLLSKTRETLYISYTKGAKKIPKIRILLPNSCRLDISAKGRSHVFVPMMMSPIRLSAFEYSEVTIGSCSGLIARQKDFSKVQINNIVGDLVINLRGSSKMAVVLGKVETATAKIFDDARLSIGGAIQSINLETKGKSTIKLSEISRTFTWVGRGAEQVLVDRLFGTADLMGNYNAKFDVKEASLSMLYASTSSTSKISIGGIVTHAALSVRGASEIVIDKLTGNILRKSESSKGIIRILTP